MTPQAGRDSEHGRPQRHPGPHEAASGPGRHRRQAGPDTDFSLAIVHTAKP